VLKFSWLCFCGHSVYTRTCVLFGLRDADSRWETDGINSTFQNETSVSCQAQRFASYTVLVVSELHSLVFRLPSFTRP